MDATPEEKKSLVQSDGKMAGLEAKGTVSELEIPQAIVPAPQPTLEPIPKELTPVPAVVEDIPDPDEDDLDDLDGILVFSTLFDRAC